MSSQGNLKSLFRIRKPLDKRIRHAKVPAESVQAAASVSTPPSSAAKKNIKKKGKALPSKCRPNVALRSSVSTKPDSLKAPRVQDSPVLLSSSDRSSPIEPSSSEADVSSGNVDIECTPPPTNRLSSRMTVSVVSNTPSPGRGDSIPYLADVDYVSDEEEEDICEIRDNRIVPPEQDPLLAHIMDAFGESPSVDQ